MEGTQGGTSPGAHVIPQADGTYSVGVDKAHIDDFNPNHGIGGMLGHSFVDYIWGHIVQSFGGDLDGRC